MVESYGGWSPRAIKLFRLMCQRRSHSPGAAMRTEQTLLRRLLIRLDVILQRYNASAILDRSPAGIADDNILMSA